MFLDTVMPLDLMLRLNESWSHFLSDIFVLCKLSKREKKREKSSTQNIFLRVEFMLKTEAEQFKLTFIKVDIQDITVICT